MAWLAARLRGSRRLVNAARLWVSLLFLSQSHLSGAGSLAMPEQ